MSDSKLKSISGHVRRGRVRSGCLTCRSRKVKCDEGHPICANCSRLQRPCRYESVPTPYRRGIHELDRPSSHIQSLLTNYSQPEAFTEIIGTLDDTTSTNSNLAIPNDIDDLSTGAFLGEWGDLFLHDPVPLSTPQSVLATTEIWQIDADQSNEFAYFLQNVEPPFITPWDAPNWARMKKYILKLGAMNSSISAAIFAVQMLYKIVGEGGDGSDALKSYLAAKSVYLASLRDESTDMDVVLLNTLLLCCFEIVAQQDTIPITLKQKDLLVSRLESWSSRPWSPVAERAAVWLRLLHTKASHLGGRGMLSVRVQEALIRGSHSIPSLVFTTDAYNTAYTATLEMYYQSLFQFYFELQGISTRTSSLNRHHRPRGALEDELKVAGISQEIKQQMDYLWQARPPIVDVTQPDLAEVLRAPMADLAALVLLSTLCKVSYYAEVIYLARARGADRMSEEISTARVHIRAMIDYEVENRGSLAELEAAFIWPLFLYSVESVTLTDANWALEKLNLISNPLWHAPFIRTVVEGLTKEQLRKDDRVDSRYFCFQEFGTVPPIL